MMQYGGKVRKYPRELNLFQDGCSQIFISKADKKPQVSFTYSNPNRNPDNEETIILETLVMEIAL